MDQLLPLRLRREVTVVENADGEITLKAPWELQDLLMHQHGRTDRHCEVPAVSLLKLCG